MDKKQRKQLLKGLQDPEIALAYLNVWFGNKPFSEDLKETLLKWKIK